MCKQVTKVRSRRHPEID
jgi:hypothetical protein